MRFIKVALSIHQNRSVDFFEAILKPLWPRSLWITRGVMAYGVATYVTYVTTVTTSSLSLSDWGLDF